jgi:acyl-CoA synthetase (AMP-forming)/AMP-acid ligase II
MNIVSHFEFAVESHPTKPAFIFFSVHDKEWKTVTFQQLADSTQRFASGLLALRSNSGQACGVTLGMTAALMTPPSADFFALAFALLKLGVVPIILDPAIGLKKVGECLEESKPDIFIGNMLTHSLRILFGWGKNSVRHNLTVESVKGKKSKVEALTTDHSSLITASSSPAAIIYTSGSTGLPKGAVYTHANLSAQLDILVETFNISPDEVDLPAFPLYALIDALIGVTSVIPDITFPVPGKTNPEKVLNAIQKFNVTNIFASPVLLDILVKYKQQAVGLQKLQSLKRVITAGAPATIQLQEDFRKLLNDETDLFGIYGATEALPIAKVESREILEVRNKSAKGAGVCLGKPVNGVKVRIIEISDSAIAQWQDSLEVLPNVVGEITVQGAAVTESYIAREDANMQSKIQDGDEVIHRMGDVGYFDEQGRLWYCGRKSHRVITNDDVLFTEQIEGIFNVHPSVYRTALVGVDQEPVLWVELSNSCDNEKIKLDLMDLAKDHPQASKIKTFLFMKKFPTDVRHNSKIIREQLTLLAEKRLR